MKSLIALFLAGTCLPTALWLSVAAASEGDLPIEGQVVATHARWTADHSRIVTDATLRLPDGSERIVTQRGGVVDDIGMTVRGGPPLLQPGDRIAMLARVGHTLRGEPRWTVKQVLRLDRESLPASEPGLLAPRYVRTRTEADRPVYWASGCVFVTYDDEGLPNTDGQAEFDAMDRVFETWRQATAQCSYVEFVLEGRESREVGIDSTNVIKFRNDRWCTPATTDSPEECHAAEAMGLTTVSYLIRADSPRHGVIVDADIEINAVNFGISVAGQSSGDGPCRADLGNVLTHEVGHLLGLADACTTSPGQTAWVDDKGEPVPACWDPNIAPEVRESTMFGAASCGETAKASLEPDDIRGLCEIYPLENDPHQCTRPTRSSGSAGESGCRVGRFGSAPRWPFALLLALVGAARVRNARSRRSRGNSR